MRTYTRPITAAGEKWLIAKIHKNFSTVARANRADKFLLFFSADVPTGDTVNRLIEVKCSYNSSNILQLYASEIIPHPEGRLKVYFVDYGDYVAIYTTDVLASSVSMDVLSCDTEAMLERLPYSTETMADDVEYIVPTPKKSIIEVPYTLCTGFTTKGSFGTANKLYYDVHTSMMYGSISVTPSEEATTDILIIPLIEAQTSYPTAYLIDYCCNSVWSKGMGYRNSETGAIKFAYPSGTDRLVFDFSVYIKDASSLFK